MFDSHAHLTDGRLRSQIDRVLARAASAGVERIVTIGTDIDDSRAAIELCHNHPQLRCAIGIQPNGLDALSLPLVPVLGELARDPAVLAIGETGLDYHYAQGMHDLQWPVFEGHLTVAAQIGRPVVVHCREAVDDTLAMLKAQPRVPAVFHCFTGSADEARRILDAGHWISFAGVVTFKNSESLREAVRMVPLDRMLIETDAPYLSPEPMRNQKTNEPALVVHTAAEIARIKNLAPADVDQATSTNAARFFGWN